MKIKIITTFVLCLIIVGIYSCSSSNTPSKTYTDYEFIFTDSTGVDTVAFGVLHLGSLQPKTSGYFEIYKKINWFFLKDSDSSKCEGTYDSVKKSIWLNMNPKLADNNVFITASFINNKLEGDWIHSTMKGIKDKGKFYAEKK